jgi:hypothetical protein
MRCRALLGVMVGLVAISFCTAPNPAQVLADGGCSASYTILGPMPGLTGATTTDWFNVFGDGFDPSVPATIGFSVPVVPYSVEDPHSVQPAVTSFTMPASDMNISFKWTFRAQDANVQAITVRIAGNACEASTVVDLSPPATSTAPDVPPVGGQSSGALLVLLVAFCGGTFAAARRRYARQG